MKSSRSVRRVVFSFVSTLVLCPFAAEAQSIDLPSPAEWAAPSGMPTAPGGAFNPTFRSASTSPEAPVVAEWNRTAMPGESFTMTGTRFTLREGSAAGSDTRVILYGSSPGGGVLEELDMWVTQEDLIVASVPDELPFGVYLVWVENEAGASAPVILNRAKAEWVGPLGDMATPGSTKRVFGKDLSTNRGETTSYVYIRPTGTTSPAQACTVTKVEPYAVSFTVPSGLLPGSYELFVHNGHGGVLGWSDPVQINIQSEWTRGSSEIILTDNGTANRAADLQSAIDAQAALPNGGTVRLGPGTFRIGTDVVLKGKVRLVGAGKAQTTLLGQGGRLRFSSTNGNRISLEDFTCLPDLGRMFMISGASFSGGNWNEDVSIRNVDFRVNSDQTSSIKLSLQAIRFELTGCLMEGVLNGAPVDWWIHNNEFRGGRDEQDGAMGLSVQKSIRHGRLVIENNNARTAAWPTGPGGSRNYKTFLTADQRAIDVPKGSVWCARLIYFALHQGSLEFSYIAHNTTNDVAIDTNKGETILFHSSEGKKYAQVASNSGRTLTIRTDGTIDDNPNFRLVYNASESLAPMTSVPAKLNFGTALNNVAYVILVDGRGKGQYRRVASTTSTTITVDRDWRVPPDRTTKFMLSHIYLGHIQYKNTLNAFPVGWTETPHAASYAVCYDGNTFNSVGDSNTSRRTYYSDALQGYPTAPSYWNEFRNSISESPYKSGQRLVSRGGDWGTNPTAVTVLGPLVLGSWLRGGSSDGGAGSEVIVEKWGAVPSNKPFIAGSGVEGVSLGENLLASSYSEVLFRRNFAATGLTPKLLLQPYAAPVLIENAATTYFKAIRANNEYSAGTRVGKGGSDSLTNGFSSKLIVPRRFAWFEASEMSLPQSFSIANGGINDLTWSAQASDPWIQATVVGGTSSVVPQALNGQLNITVNPFQAPLGVVSGNVSVSSGPQTVQIGVSGDNEGLLMYEAFDYGPNNISLTSINPTLNRGTGLSGSWNLVSRQGNRGSYISTGLTFGALLTSGGALRAEAQWSNSSVIHRPISFSQVGTIFGSYLVSSGNRNRTIDPNTESSELIIGSPGQSAYYADLSVAVKAWNANPAVGGTKIGRSSGGSFFSGAPVTFSDSAPQTFLVLFKASGLGGAAKAQKALKVWILNAAQFAHFRSNPSDSLTEAELDAAGLGVNPGQVLQRGGKTTGLPADLNQSKVLRIAAAKAQSSFIWNVTYDEIRLSPYSFDAVTPIAP